MSFQYIKDTVKILEKFIEKHGGKVVSCTQEEIDKLESMLPDSYRLPAAYKEFLLYGGKKIGQFYEPGNRFDYERALDYVKSGRSSAISLLKQYEDNPKLPDDVYILTTYMSSYFNFFKLTEGENPPVYEWNEEDEIGTEAIVKAHDSFTDFIRDEVRIRHLLLIRLQTRKELEAGNPPPRGRQFWVPIPEEKTEGIREKDLAKFFGIDPLWRVEEITEKLNITPIEYLEELSGWKAIKVGDEVRFFPPSYESPEQKEKKAIELQNTLESKRQELAKVQKRITNLQDRIKNLSGGKLTGGIDFNNPSKSRIKELEKDIRKQKILQQNLEKEIAKLEKEFN